MLLWKPRTALNIGILKSAVDRNDIELGALKGVIGLPVVMQSAVLVMHEQFTAVCRDVKDSGCLKLSCG